MSGVQDDWLALFVGNVASVVSLNWLVPWASKRLNWWLQPGMQKTLGNQMLGTGIVVGIYAAPLPVCSSVLGDFIADKNYPE